MTISAPGVYDNVPAEQYHADRLLDNHMTVSASLLKILLKKTPRHAWLAHPRLNKDYLMETAAKFDIGSAAHALLLEGQDAVVVIGADSFRTKDAKEARDAAYEAGKIPLLTAQAADVVAMQIAALAQLKNHEEAFDAFAEGKPEQTLIWQEEGGIWCRARLDWLKERTGAIWDYKTTTSAQPDDWQRRLFDLGGDLQEAWYRRGVKALGLSNDPQFRFIVQEVEAPYALSVIGLTPAAQALGEMKVWRALEIWRWCRANDRWPGYPNQTCYIEPPAWEMAKGEEMKVRAEMAPLDALTDWQAPLTTEAAE